MTKLDKEGETRLEIELLTVVASDIRSRVSLKF